MLIDVPDGKDPISYVWGEMVPHIGPAAARFSGAVYEHSTLELRVFEAARLRIAQSNGCVFCQDWRTVREGVQVEAGFDDEVRAWRTSTVLSDRERLAAEYAQRYAEDHHGLEPGADDAFWERMFACFTQAEVVELTMCLGSWIAFGRLNRVLGLDVVCVLPSHPVDQIARHRGTGRPRRRDHRPC
jgi:alkylhydroperoxidase family enzyme